MNIVNVIIIVKERGIVIDERYVCDEGFLVLSIYVSVVIFRSISIDGVSGGE